MKRIVIIVIIGVMIAATLGAAAIPAQAEYKPAPVMRPRAALADNLVAYWKLDEASSTRNDSVGTNHLTSNNSVGQATGKLNYAANFVAANSQYLSIADNADLSVGDIDFTVSAWIWLDSAGGARGIVGKGNSTYVWSSVEYALLYLNSSDGLQFRV